MVQGVRTKREQWGKRDLSFDDLFAADPGNVQRLANTLGVSGKDHVARCKAIVRWYKRNKVKRLYEPSPAKVKEPK